MIKCHNCSSDAQYVFPSAVTKPQYFCKPCVPWGLKPRMNVSILNQEPEAPVVEEKPKKKAKAVVEDSPVEEPKEEVAVPEAVVTDEHTDN